MVSSIIMTMAAVFGPGRRPMATGVHMGARRMHLSRVSVAQGSLTDTAKITTANTRHGTHHRLDSLSYQVPAQLCLLQAARISSRITVCNSQVIILSVPGT